MTGAERQVSPPTAHAATESEEAHLVALASLDGIGPATLLGCHRGEGAEAAWMALISGRGQGIEAFARWERSAPKRSLVRLRAAATSVDPAAALARHRAAGVRVLVVDRLGYPTRLQRDPVPPAVLFSWGLPLVEGRPSVAIVGTRNATRLGCETAGALAGQLAVRGIDVVSGLALGIDGAAHKAMIAASQARLIDECLGRPVGVVASGPDIPYPPRHARLHRSVSEVGSLLGETPLGGPAQRWRFPARNRIIAALADAVVVVESRSAGGAMLTAAEAVARDVPVLAVPGHPTAPASAGTLDLLCDGATPVRDIEDVLVSIGHGGRPPMVPEADRSLGNVGSVTDELGIRAALQRAPMSVAELVDAVGAPFPEVAAALTELELAGHVVRTGSWCEITGGEAVTNRIGGLR